MGIPSVDGMADSMTGWISDSSGTRAAVLFQVDALSFVLAPRSAGFIALDPSLFRVSLSSAATPALGFTAAAGVTRHVSFQLPDAFQAPGAAFHLSLLEDLDEDPSAGWVSNLRVVPEPVGLFALGGILMLISRGSARVSAGRWKGRRS